MKVEFLNAQDRWAVIGDHGEVLENGLDNAGAWRALDKLKMEPLSRREETVEWAARRNDQ